MKPRPETVRVLCVDDHEVLIQGLTARLQLEPGFEVVGSLSAADELAAEVERLEPDIVVLDIAMPGADAFEAADDLRRLHPDTRVVFLTAYLRDRYLDAAFRVGAWGYLFKGDPLDDIVDGIRRVSRGEFVVGGRALERWRAEPPDRDSRPASRLALLTPRERQILTLIGQGLSRHEIAETLHRSVKTIDTHRAAIMEKTGIHDRTELALFAVREGLAPPSPSDEAGGPIQNA